MIIYQKYSFDSQAYAEDLIDQLVFVGVDGETYPLYQHTVSNYGFLIKTPPTFDDEGHQLTPPIYYDKWAVDVLWRDLPQDEEGNIIFPEGWQEYLLTGLRPYKRGYIGWSYNK